MPSKGKREIIIVSNIGFCSGVERAVKIAEDNANKFKEIYTIDSLLHNEVELKKLEEKGIKVATTDTIGNIIIVPAHGSTEEEIKKFKKSFKNVVDATCNLVLRNVKLVKNLKKEGYKIAIVGDKGHRETMVLQNTAGNNLLGVFKDYRELDKISFCQKIAIIAQTTATEEMLLKISQQLLRKAYEVRFFNTICNETIKRQTESVAIAKKVQCMVVVGGKTSANSKRLFEVIKKINKNTLFVNNEAQISKIDLSNYKSIGITSGTSTPKWLIEKIVKRIEK
jgi:(E)-4-hydroxy-3-methyl-but-2-enyl pyrophosphate reductase